MWCDGHNDLQFLLHTGLYFGQLLLLLVFTPVFEAFLVLGDFQFAIDSVPFPPALSHRLPGFRIHVPSAST